jgi:hypothetical protein
MFAPEYGSNREVEAELERLPDTRIAELRIRYHQLFRTEPPKAFGPDLLRRTIAYRIQENVYGGLSKQTRRLLDRLVKEYRAKPDSKITLPRRIKAGSVIVREWQGITHRVIVLDDGFAWQGKTWASLSEIARQITGTRWNGPRFFGLRTISEEPVTAKSRSTAPTDPPSTPKHHSRKARRNHGL